MSNSAMPSWKPPPSVKVGSTSFPISAAPTTRLDACGSPKAQQDILDAVEWAKNKYNIDAQRIYLTGSSGGGHMTMLMAGRHPQVWAAASAWVGISDLAAWHERHAGSRYGRMMRAACGGKPGDKPEVDEQYRSRSPLTHLHRAVDVPIDLAAGVHDGHKGSVPIRHTLEAFNVIARAADATPISEAEIDQLSRKDGRLDRPQDSDQATDPSFGREIYLRRTAAKARVTIFEGGHEGIATAAIALAETAPQTEVGAFNMATDKPLAGQVAWVTGSSRGLGREMAAELCRLGAKVAVHGTQQDSPKTFGEGESMQQVAEDISAACDGETMPTWCDATQEDEVTRVVAEIHQRWGQIDLMVCCAGGDIGAGGTGVGRGGRPEDDDCLNISLPDMQSVMDRKPAQSDSLLPGRRPGDDAAQERADHFHRQHCQLFRSGQRLDLLGGQGRRSRIYALPGGAASSVQRPGQLRGTGRNRGPNDFCEFTKSTKAGWWKRARSIGTAARTRLRPWWGFCARRRPVLSAGR